MSEENKESRVATVFSSIRSTLDSTHQFIDTHPRTIKNSVYGIGALGVVVLLRSVHVARFIRNGRDIPRRFISNGVHLQGKVKEVNPDGVVYVQHIPILDLRLPWLREERLDYLPTNLAFVELNIKSKDWMRENLVNKSVWFQVLKEESDENQAIQTSLYRQKFIFWKSCINDKLIADGMCKVINIPDDDMKTLNKKETELLNRLIGLEKIADKKGRGIWKEDKPPFKHVVKQSAKKILYVPVIMTKMLYEKVKNRFVKS